MWVVPYYCFVYFYNSVPIILSYQDNVAYFFSYLKVSTNVIKCSQFSGNTSRPYLSIPTSAIPSPVYNNDPITIMLGIVSTSIEV